MRAAHISRAAANTPMAKFRTINTINWCGNSIVSTRRSGPIAAARKTYDGSDGGHYQRLKSSRGQTA